MEFSGEDSYRLFYQSLEKVKQHLNPAALQLICEQLTEEQGISTERLSQIIQQQIGDCNVVILVFILTLLAISNDETFITYQQVYNEGNTASQSRKREEELKEQLVDLQKKFVKLQKENEQFRLANERWAQDYDELMLNASGTVGAGGERGKALEEKLKVERSNYEILRGKYNLLEQTMKEEREELITLRRESARLNQQQSNDDMTSTVADMQEAHERISKDLEEVKQTKERYRMERNRYYHELDKQRRSYEADKKQLQETVRVLESQCDRMRVAFSQVSDIVYPPKATTKTKSSRTTQNPPGHVARGPTHSNDVERDKQISSQQRNEQVTGVTRLNGHDLLNGTCDLLNSHDKLEKSSTYSSHVIPCTACSKEIPLDKFLEHMEQCTVSAR